MTVIAVLLTFGSGAMDVASFTRLGSVFASVMTGNIVVFGLSLARGSVSLASHTLTSVGGYVIGVAVGTRVAWFHGRRSPGKPADSPWPPHVTMAFLLEFLLMAGVATGWEITGGKPAGGGQFVILALAACSMGIQSAAVMDMGLKEVSTTFLTGTLTGLVGSLAARDGRPVGLRRPGVLAGLASGAILAGVLVAYVPDLVPALPLGALATVIVLGSRSAPPPVAPKIPVPRQPLSASPSGVRSGPPSSCGR
jgi:uncharacterized membrane protein YoaK (UPF0700 family)